MTEESLVLDRATTALVLIDLQQGIVARAAAPYPSADVVARGVQLARAARAIAMPVVLVRVGWMADQRDRLTPPADAAVPGGPLPAGWMDLLPEVGPESGDIVITKRQWGAFYGTELDLQLRRRGTRTIIIAGIATNFGVESTARDAWERGYALAFVEDAMTSVDADLHRFAVTGIFPRLGRVRSTAQVLAALASATA
jgi:nicotinamidase-related amidase